jgi:hypothetical protein
MQFFQKFVSIATSTFASTIYLHGIFQSIIKYILSDKGQKDKQRSTKHTHNTKVRVTQTLDCDVS